MNPIVRATRRDRRGDPLIQGDAIFSACVDKNTRFLDSARNDRGGISGRNILPRPQRLKALFEETTLMARL